MNNRLKGIILLAFTAILWSMGGLFIKSVTWNPLAIAGMRSLIAALVLLVAIRKPKFTWSKAQIGAAVSYAFVVILFVSANKLTTAANAILLQYTAPIYVAILSFWILKEKIKLMDWITIAFVFGGMILFFMDKLTASGIMGNILALLSGLCFALFTILMRMQKDGSPAESVLLGNILTFVIGLPFMFQSPPALDGWMNLLILGIFQLGISYVLFSKAIKLVSALDAIIIPVLEPILNPVWVAIFLSETPGQWALIGGIVVILAVTVRCILSSFDFSKKKSISA